MVRALVLEKLPVPVEDQVPPVAEPLSMAVTVSVPVEHIVSAILLSETPGAAVTVNVAAGDVDALPSQVAITSQVY